MIPTRRPARLWKKIGRTAGIIFLLLFILFQMYASQYYGADADAAEAVVSDNTVMVQETDSYYYFDGPGESDAYIFYPGAKVETVSYAPLMQKIAETGMDVFLVDMPYHLAFFGINRADDIMKQYSDYTAWYIGGHSLGGAMAAEYAADHLDELDGAILMAAYPTKSLKADGFQVISFYGSEDQVLNMDKFEAGRAYMPEDYYEVEIAGGNHAQFGSYGNQKGDGTASISAEKQQDIVVEQIRAIIGLK